MKGYKPKNFEASNKSKLSLLELGSVKCECEENCECDECKKKIK